MKHRILFVCMGNICRSPTAEAIFRSKIIKYQLTTEIDSAGTIGFHQGHSPDKRSIAAGNRRGLDFSAMQARQVRSDDFESFDMILAADKANLADLKALCPAHLQHKLQLMLSFAILDTDEVPDPYYGGCDGFERVLDLLDASLDALAKTIQQGL
ncbi:low molecular weight protein-tyrosine-phosphatase [Shewanella sp. SR44-3]|uniref:low molecular weight protein-tyrosine-phosphatase n=1 Tax=unclassified Shewanella TaxID=196818 RepID=UPI003857DCE2